MPCSGNGLPRGDGGPRRIGVRVGGIDHRQFALRRRHRRVSASSFSSGARRPDRPGRSRCRATCSSRSGRRVPSSGCSTSVTAPAREPVRIDGVLVRLAQRRPEHPRLLRLAPRHVLVRERAHEALHGLHGVVALRRARARCRERTVRSVGAAVCSGVEAGPHAVALEQLRRAVLAVARARCPGSPSPSGRPSCARSTGAARRSRARDGRSGAAPSARRMTHVMRSTSVDFATASWTAHESVLALARAPAIEQRGDDARRRAARRRCG